MARNHETLPARRSGEGRMARWDDGGWLSPGSLLTASPWQMMRRMQEDMDRLLGQFVGIGGESRQPGVWAPNMDVCEDDCEWTLTVDLPGVNRDAIHVNVQNGQIDIKAEMRREEPGGEGQEQGGERRYHRRERQYGSFERIMALPGDVDEQNIRCEFHDGVLTCHLPKSKEAQAAARAIPVSDGPSPQPQPGATSKTSGQK
ncbi:MAG: Hsp20/alpha crystallin family protein [Chthonomonadales bacterium]|nr:Hsp20/alpha crystallin family protein [Chthonomonadales bacterium]